MEAKTTHLELIQAVIGRMSNNSFLLKGWSVTVVGGLLAFSLKELNCLYIFISLAVLFFFWLLDSYYLSRERRFIRLYNHARKQKEEAVDFSMDIDPFGVWSDWLDCALSTTLAIFYGGLLFVHLFILLIL